MPFTVMPGIADGVRTGVDAYTGPLRSNQSLPARIGTKGSRGSKISKEASIYRFLS